MHRIIYQKDLRTASLTYIANVLRIFAFYRRSRRHYNTESVNVITNFVQYILCYIIRYYSSNTSAHITHTRFAHIAQDHPYEHTHLNPHKTIHTRGM